MMSENGIICIAALICLTVMVIAVCWSEKKDDSAEEYERKQLTKVGHDIAKGFSKKRK